MAAPLGERIARIGIPQSVLAKRADVSRTTLRKYMAHGGEGEKYEAVVRVLDEIAGHAPAQAEGFMAAAARLQHAARDITGEEPDADLMELVAKIKRLPDREAARIVDAVLLTARIVRRDDSTP